MRDGRGTRLLRIVNKIPLSVEIGFLAHDLDGVLVRAHRAVRAEAIEHAAHHALVRVGAEIFIPIQAGMAEVVVDADREMVFRLVLPQFIEHAPDHARREFLGRESIATAHHARHPGEPARSAHKGLADRRHHILVERLPVRTRFLGPVQHGDAFRRGGNDLEQCVRCERAEQTHLHHAGFFAMMIEVVDHFIHRLGAGTHQHDHAIGIRRAVIFIKRYRRPVSPANLSIVRCTIAGMRW